MNKIVDELLQEIEGVENEDKLKDIKVKYLGRGGIITLRLREIKNLPPEERREAGFQLNSLKNAVEKAIKKKHQEIVEKKLGEEILKDTIDLTLPSLKPEGGHLHPLTIIQMEIERIFEGMGFYVMDYPEAESDFFNFEGLNIPKDHPARDMQDTFYLKDGNLLRTHTSSGQVRAIREIPPPFRAIFPGRVYRYEATDASHEHTFHQIEGLMIDKDISVANMLSVMMTLLEGVFKRKLELRLRPGYFPFVEPGFELDMCCMVCNGNGCSVCKHSGWVEILPCGPVHPNVIRAGGLDPLIWTGWAFGLGLSRLVMMKHGIDDIRYLMGADLRFLHQF